ncbi:hypothetical protein Tco_0837369 [Tanacetum coccineum]
MGQSSAHDLAHGSAPVDDDDNDSHVEEMSPVKAKKLSKHASKAKKNDTKEKETPKDWTTAKEIALCRAWCDVSENGEKGNAMNAKGFWDAVIKYFIMETGAKKSKTSETTSGSASDGFNLNNEAGEFEETQEHRSMGRDRSKAKKKSPTSSCEGSSSFVDLVADEFLNIKTTKWEKMQEQQDSCIQLKNQELDIQEEARKEAAELKRAKLKIQHRTLELAGKKNWTKTSYSIIQKPTPLCPQYNNRSCMR